MSIDKKNKIWIVSELYFPSATSTGYILTKIAEGLTAEHHVNVITGPPSYWDKTGTYNLHETVGNVEIYRVRIPYLNKNNSWKRILRLTLVSVALAWKAIRLVDNNSTIIVVTNPVPILFFITLIKSIKKNIRLFILVHDVYPDNMVTAGLIKRNGAYYKVLNSIFKNAFLKADQLIVLGRDMYDVFDKKGIHNATIIENWSETGTISPIRSYNGKPEQANSPKNKKVFLFAGNFGRVQGIPQLLEAIHLVESPVAHFIFAGNGAMENHIKQNASQSGVNNISLAGSFDRSQQNEILNACDFGIVSLAKGMYGLGVPSKAYNLMAAAKPILYIGESGSEIDLIIREHDCGWSVEPGDPRHIAKVIDEICNTTKDLLQHMSRNSQNLAIDKYSLNNTLRKYHKLVQL